MKNFILLFVILLSTASFANNKDFLKCMGQEEKYFHKNKLAGPYHKLNQKLISSFIQMSTTLSLKKSFQNEICYSKDSLPSLKALEIILINKRKAFKSSAPNGDLVKLSIDRQSIDEITLKSFKAFIDLINQLQTESNSANCIIKNIPELESFYFKARHIQEDVGLEKLINEIKDLKKVFSKLNSKDVNQNCFEKQVTAKK